MKCSTMVMCIGALMFLIGTIMMALHSMTEEDVLAPFAFEWWDKSWSVCFEKNSDKQRALVKAGKKELTQVILAKYLITGFNYPSVTIMTSTARSQTEETHADGAWIAVTYGDDVFRESGPVYTKDNWKKVLMRKARYSEFELRFSEFEERTRVTYFESGSVYRCTKEVDDWESKTHELTKNIRKCRGDGPLSFNIKPWQFYRTADTGKNVPKRYYALTGNLEYLIADGLIFSLHYFDHNLQLRDTNSSLVYSC